MTRMPFLSALRTLRRDEQGSSLIEFALVLPLLAMMVMGISDVALGYSSKLTMEAAAYRALEKVAVRTDMSDFSALRAEAATAAGVDQSAVTVDLWLECDRVRQTDVNAACAAGADSARYVEVRIDTTYEPQFNYGPLAESFARDDGLVPISASAALRFQ